MQQQIIIRQSVGIDIAKSSSTACFCQQLQDGTLIFSKSVKFDNTKTGFNQLLKWTRKQSQPHPQPLFVMEATGNYYEPLAYHLHKLKQSVSVVLPNKVKHYSKSLNIKIKTDQQDARLIAKLGAERGLSLWEPPSAVLKQLRALTRHYTDLKVQRTGFNNQLQSVEAGYEPSAFILKSIKGFITKLDKEIQKTHQAIVELISSEEWLNQKVEKLMSIKGVGLITVAIILAETQGFALIRNRKQLASYAGYDVVQRESGSSIKGKTRISKKGNSRIRAALHFPALVASRFNPELLKVYHRVNENKASKMIGATTLQRKILLLLYTLWKNDTVYQNMNEKGTSRNQETKPLLRLKGEALEK